MCYKDEIMLLQESATQSSNISTVFSGFILHALEFEGTESSNLARKITCLGRLNKSSFILRIRQ